MTEPTKVKPNPGPVRAVPLKKTAAKAAGQKSDDQGKITDTVVISDAARGPKDKPVRVNSNYGLRPDADYTRAEISTKTSRDKAVDLVTDQLVSFMSEQQESPTPIDRNLLRSMIDPCMADADKDGYFDIDLGELTASLDSDLFPELHGDPMLAESMHAFLLTTELPDNIRLNTYIVDGPPKEIFVPAKSDPNLRQLTKTEAFRILDQIGFFTPSPNPAIPFDPLDPKQVADRLIGWGKDKGIFLMKDGRLVRDAKGGPVFRNKACAVDYFELWSAHFKVYLQPDFINGDAGGAQASLDDRFAATTEEIDGLAKSDVTYTLGGKQTTVTRAKIDCAGYAAFVNQMARHLGLSPTNAYAVLVHNGEAAGHAITGFSVRTGNEDTYFFFDNDNVVHNTIPISELGGFNNAAVATINFTSKGKVSVAFMTDKLTDFSNNFHAFSSYSQSDLATLSPLSQVSYEMQYNIALASLPNASFEKEVTDKIIPQIARYPELAKGTVALQIGVISVGAKSLPDETLSQRSLYDGGFQHYIYRVLTGVDETKKPEALKALREKYTAIAQSYLAKQIEALKTIRYETLDFPLTLTTQTVVNPSLFDPMNFRAEVKTLTFNNAQELKSFVDGRIKTLEKQLIAVK